MKLRMFSILGGLGLLIGHAYRAMPQTAQAPALSLADAETRIWTIIGLFALSWVLSIAIYRWRRFDDLELSSPLPTPIDPD